MNSELATKPVPQVEGGLALMGDPRQMLAQARHAADVLIEVVEKQELYQDIGKQRHLLVEAWQFCAHFYGITARVVSCEPYTDELTGAAGFKATADALHMITSQVISSASALCLNNEDNWNMRPKYEWSGPQGQRERRQIGEVRVPSQQLASMAQTRAISKVLSNVLRFVVVLAGFNSTPAEEMTGDEHSNGEEKKPGREPERKSASNGGGKVITEPQRKRLFAIMKEIGCPMNIGAQIWIAAGFNVAADITMEKYDAVIENIRNWQSQPQAAEKK